MSKRERCANCGEMGVCVPDPIGPTPDPICEACIATLRAVERELEEEKED